MLNTVKEIRKSAEKEIRDTGEPTQLERLRITYLGRKGRLTQILRSLKDLSLEERRRVGPAAQRLRRELEESFVAKKAQLTTNDERPTADIDITKPGKRIKTGHLHPLSKLEEEIRKIFLSLNFSVVEGPEVETEHYNFDALNIPPNHPARDMWDTFWLKPTNNQQPTTNNKSRKSSVVGGKLLLRTHTSPMQIRYMETHNPPFQIIVPGRVFRYEALDATHEINFHQIEGLMVGRDISLANLKFVIETFLKKLFGEAVEFRYRPSYFPFVEPGLEVDIKIAERRGNAPAGGRGTTQKKERWLEIMGAGMVHREVWKAVRYNPNEWQGFAFGMGLERLAMIKYKIPDIRLFYSGDTRFVEQF